MRDEAPGSAPGTQEELNLGLLLFIPYRAMEKAVLDALAAVGYDMTVAQARVFQRIDQDGSRITDLAEAAVLTKQTVGLFSHQLERAGYVERTARSAGMVVRAWFASPRAAPPRCRPV